MKALPILCALLFSTASCFAAETPPQPALPKIPGGKPRSIVLILTDDHRYDAMGFTGHPFLKTPHMDALARGGAHLRNAFVTTALCSPSRASIITGLYAHRHRLTDNNTPLPAGLTFFPQYLQQAGYATAFMGKWHMGDDSDAPQPGFDHWVGFKGHGTYWPNPNGLNVDGRHVAQQGYLTDELTDYAVKWLDGRTGDKPFFLYLSHKAVHNDLVPDKAGQGRLLVPGSNGEMRFLPAPRHAGRYANEPFTPPESMALTPRNFADKPMWVQNRRNSRHGLDFPFGNKVDVATIYRQYMETLLAVDDSVGRVMDALRRKKLLESTLVIYMGDNGYAWGEHGMIDKRAAYEASMRIPMIAHCPELIPGGIEVRQMVANIDIAPTLLAAAGLQAPPSMDGRSILPLMQVQTRGRAIPWRDKLLYEYYWEWNFPMTPTIHAIRTDRYKYIRPYGVWDTEELYDLQTDPHEIVNLLRDPQRQQVAKAMKARLFEMLKETHGMAIPLSEDRGGLSNQRNSSGTPQAPFPPYVFRQAKPAAVWHALRPGSLMQVMALLEMTRRLWRATPRGTALQSRLATHKSTRLSHALRPGSLMQVMALLEMTRRLWRATPRGTALQSRLATHKSTRLSHALRPGSLMQVMALLEMTRRLWRATPRGTALQSRLATHKSRLSHALRPGSLMQVMALLEMTRRLWRATPRGTALQSRLATPKSRPSHALRRGSGACHTLAKGPTSGSA